ncbi:MAG: hypothetical protein SFY32_14610, partial [Bacteroidota bacterium]|nr:hypothetical protein [Bacteroidota bacterium]
MNQLVEISIHLQRFVLLAILLINTNLFSQCIAPVIYPKMGVNLDGISNYHSARIFTDFAKEANLRNGPSNGSDYWGGYSGSLNASGWPTTAFLLSLVECACLDPAFTGTYRIRYLGGTGAIQSGGNVTGVTNVGGGYTEANLSINNSGNQWITFNSSVSELQIIPIVLNGTPTNYTFTNFPTFSPNVTSTYANFNLYRMMDWGNTNGNSVSSWANRTKKGGVQSLSTGVAYEYMVEIANVTGKDLWINIPVMADDNFITQLATLVKNNLRPDRNVWLEYGNEIWNTGGGFYGYQMNNLMAANRANSSAYWNNLLRNGSVRGYDGGSLGTNCVQYGFPAACGFNAYSVAMRFQALRTKEISDIFGSVWGTSEINNRVRVLLGGQIGYGGKGYGYNIAEGLQWLRENGWEPKNSLHAIAGAPYFNLNGASTTNTTAILNGMQQSVTDMFLCHNCNGPDGNQIEGFAGKAKEFGLKFIAYEGGPDLDYTTGWTSQKRDAKRNAQMKTICLDYWNKWYAYGDDGQFNLFAGGFSDQYTGLYAWAENINDNSPTRQAVNQIMTSPNPTLTAGWTIPGLVDARKVYGWADCGDMYQCCYGSRCSADFPGNMYNHSGGDDTWLISSNANANYTIEVQAEYWTNAQGRLIIDGNVIGTYAINGVNARTWYTLTVAGKTSFPLNWGTHTVGFEYTSENSDLYQLRFTQVAPNPPSQPNLPSGRLSICNGGENNITYFVPYDRSVCQYEWSITGSNIQTVGATNLNVLTVNYLNGFASGTIRVRAVGAGPTYSAWSNPANITSLNCGITANLLVPCAGQSINFSETSGVGTTWRWDFGDANATVTGATTATPSVRFSSLGLKTIIVYVNENTNTPYTFYKNNYINVLNCVSAPTAAINLTTTSACTSANISMGNASTGIITSTSWNFGVGATPATSNASIPGTVSYASAGVKTITLIVAGSGGMSTITSALTISGTVTPTAQISTTTPTICAGQLTQFTSTISGGGATPTYQWQVNGSNVGTNSNTYTTTGLTNGQIVRLILTSSSACASPTSATSTGVTMTVNPNLTPGVSIAALQNNVCSGTG